MCCVMPKSVYENGINFELHELKSVTVKSDKTAGIKYMYVYVHSYNYADVNVNYAYRYL